MHIMWNKYFLVFRGTLYCSMHKTIRTCPSHAQTMNLLNGEKGIFQGYMQA